MIIALATLSISILITIFQIDSLKIRQHECIHSSETTINKLHFNSNKSTHIKNNNKRSA